MAVRITYRINAIEGSSSHIYLWEITNLITGEIKLYPVASTDFSMKVQSTTDYTFIWNQNFSNPLACNVNDIEYIGGSTSAPAYNNSATDLAAILALI